MKSKPFVILLIVLLICTGSFGVVDQAPPYGVYATNRKITLGTFNELPPDLEGCTCLFFETAKAREELKYLFANDFGLLGYACVNGSLTEFEKIEHHEIDTIYTYKSGDLVLKLFRSRRSAENTEISGFIEVSAGNESARRDFVGSCGC